MILQRVRLTIQPLGVGYANSPQKAQNGGGNSLTFWFFSDFEPKKCFGVPTPRGLYGVEWDERLCNDFTFQAFFVCWGF